MSGRIHLLTLPKWGLTMTEGTIGAWRVEVGAFVAVGDTLAEIESSKIVNELEAHVPGTLRRRLAQEGDTCNCGALIGVVTEGPVTEADIDACLAAHAAGASADTVEVGVSDGDLRAAAASSRGPTGTQSAVAATLYAEELAQRWRLEIDTLTGSGGRGRVTKLDVVAAAAAAGRRDAAAVGRASTLLVPPKDSTHASTPIARRLAAKLGIPLASIGLPAGAKRIRKADVVAAAGRHAAAPQLALAESAEFEARPFSSMRRVIGQRLLQSKSIAPHYRLVIDLEVDRLLELRKRAADEQDIKVSLNDLLIKAAAQALMAVPEVNVHVETDRVKVFKDANVAVAIAVDSGLMTPVVRCANRKGVREISVEMRGFGAKARDAKLRAEDIEGGSFTLSNLGMFGVRNFDAIINPPQGAILAVGAARRQRLIGDNDTDYLATTVTATLSCDHRAIDGVCGARFLEALRGFVEEPATTIL